MELESRRLLCACRSCALLFAEPRKEGGDRYRTVPERVLVDTDFDLEWERLGVPVGLAFFFYSTPRGQWIAVYPSAAGATEAELPDGALESFSRERLARSLAPDVEALLVRRPKGASVSECFLAPIDLCHRLVELVCSSFDGLGGGKPARGAIDAFFTRLRARSHPLEAHP